MRASKRDKNEPGIRKRAEALGFLWLENNASTKGRPDACLLRNGRTYWCEVKEPGASFTPAQMREFPRISANGIPVFVLETVEHVELLGMGVLNAWSPSDAKVVRDAKGQTKGKRRHRPGYSRARLGHFEMCIGAFCPKSRLPGRDVCAKCAGEGTK